MDDLVVDVEGLRRSYGARVALDGIDLQVHRGEVVALLGPNGAGKTTTVEILEGHRRRDAGRVRVLGEDPATAGAAWRSRVGIVLQDASDAADLTVAETVRHFASFYRHARDPEEVLAAVGLLERRGVRVRTLSGGQRRRLDVALGIVGDPELLFLDEPTTGFDPQARRSFWDLVASLRAGGTTILLTTHYLDEAEALADRVAVVDAGRVRAFDTVEGLARLHRDTAVVTWRDAEGRHRETTDDPTALVVALAARSGGPLADLEVRRPDLEEVYLALVGTGTVP